MPSAPRSWILFTILAWWYYRRAWRLYNIVRLRYSYVNIWKYPFRPEISQCFGEVLAANLIHKWIQFGQKRPITLIELGPGRGTLMSDVLRTFSGFNWISEKLKRVIMVESSDSLMERQKQTVSFPVTSWVRDFAALNAEDFKDGERVAQCIEIVPIHAEIYV